MPTCSCLAQSFEHEAFRALSRRANHRGLISDGIAVASRLTGRAPSYVREAVDTLIDADLLERVGPGTYLLSDRCRCKPEDVFERENQIIANTNMRSIERKGAIVLSGAQSAAAKPTRDGDGGRGGREFQGLSRSLPSRRNSTISAQLNKLTYQFVRRCNEEGISPRGYNAAALRANLNRWFREGLSIDLMEEMIELFVKIPSSQLGPRAVAWKLFVSKREELERRARRNLPPQPEEISAARARMQRGMERYDRLAAAVL